jgi:hypothetical protein
LGESTALASTSSFSDEGLSAAKRKASKLILSNATTRWAGVHGVSDGKCKGFWAANALDLPTAGLGADYQGVRVFFTNKQHLQEFAKATLLLGDKISVEVDGNIEHVPVCGLLDDPTVIHPSVTGGNN